MERFVFISILLFGGCTSPTLEQSELKNCHQIVVADNHVFCLEIYDKYGEKNSLKLFDNKLELIDSKSIETDPLPRISKISNDTIILKYILSSNMEGKSGTIEYVKPDFRGYAKIGKYSIIWKFSYESNGEGIGNTYSYDSVSISENFHLIFYYKGREVVNKSISQYSFYQGNISFDDLSKRQLSRYTILRSNYLSPTNDDVLNRCYDIIFISLKKF